MSSGFILSLMMVLKVMLMDGLTLQSQRVLTDLNWTLQQQSHTNVQDVTCFQMSVLQARKLASSPSHPSLLNTYA